MIKWKLFKGGVLLKNFAHTDVQVIPLDHAGLLWEKVPVVLLKVHPSKLP